MDHWLASLFLNGNALNPVVFIGVEICVVLTRTQSISIRCYSKLLAIADGGLLMRESTNSESGEPTRHHSLGVQG